MTVPLQEIPTYTRKDFVSDQTVRWCPGCGDYAILAAVQKAMPEIGKRKEDIVFVSGIGCSSRFPYYMNTYGLHTVHGRAPTLATGLKITNPNLSIWVITGDGDGLSIGGNHMLHVCRRNVDLNILLFNNRIYGLTKGQYSPTSPVGQKTKSTPMGSIDYPLNPIAIALGAEATMIARTIDTNTKHLEEIIIESAKHKGASFIEILQNCVIFNDGAWNHVSDKKTQDETVLFLEHGKPMIFGANRDKGIRLNGMTPEVVTIGQNGISEADLLVHDETNPMLAYLLAHMDYPQFPVPMGVIYRVDRPSYEELLLGQVAAAQKSKGTGDLKALYHADYTWTVEAGAETEANVSASQEVEAVLESTGALDDEYMDTVITQSTGDAIGEPGELAVGLNSDPLSRLYDPKRPLIAVTPETSLAEAVTLMQERNVGGLVVLDANRQPVGIFTEADVLRRVATQVTDLNAAQVGAYMTPNPDVLPANVPIAHAVHLMAMHRYRHVPIVDEEGKAITMISFRDVVHYIEQYFTEREHQSSNR